MSLIIITIFAENRNRNMYKKLSIQHFRGIRSLQTDALAQINIFLGRNNSGKTSVLEALFLSPGMTTGFPIFIVNHVRGVRPDALEQGDVYMFFNQDHSQPIIITTEGLDFLGYICQKVEINPSFEDIGKVSQSIEKEGIKSTTGTQFPTGLNVTVEHKREDKEENKLHQTVVNFLPTREIDANTTPNFERIVELDLKGDLVQLLQEFDHRVTGIELIKSKIMLRIEGMENMLPIQFVGDGLRRFFSIWAAVCNPDNQIVLIDEIDNGIHHSSFCLLWRTLLKVAERRSDLQIFVTTHNEEAILELEEAIEQLNSENIPAVALHSLVRQEMGDVKVYSYEPKDFSLARERFIDLRN